MRIVLAPDSFKECASAARVASAMAAGVRRASLDAEIDLAPVADGGEGTVEAMVTATGGRTVEVDVTGPLGTRRKACYGILGDGQTAVVEAAAASGLHLVPRERRDPRVTTTRGTGELIRHALDAGFRRIVVGLGGSGTNDLGAGMAQALGYRLKDRAGRELASGGAALAGLNSIDTAGVHPALRQAEIVAACDVDNPLCGPSGASHVYGPQKGATPETAAFLDQALQHAGRLIDATLHTSILSTPGAGAAGGLGGGVMAFLGGRLRPGIEVVAEATRLEQRIVGASLVMTAEGAIDAQTVHGKTPVGVARLAHRHGVPVVALAGRLGEGFENVCMHGIAAAFSIVSGPMELSEAIERVDELLAETAEAVVKVWLAARARSSE